MYSEIFYFLFVVIFLVFIFAIMYKNPTLFLMSTILIGALALLLGGTGIDYALGTEIEYNATGDINATHPLYTNISPDNDKGLWAIQQFMLWGSFILVGVSLWWMVKHYKNAAVD